MERALGGVEQASLFCRAYNIRTEGNCTLSERSDPHDEFGGKNVPIIITPLRVLAEEVSRLLRGPGSGASLPSLSTSGACLWG